MNKTIFFFSIFLSFNIYSKPKLIKHSNFCEKTDMKCLENLELLSHSFYLGADDEDTFDGTIHPIYKKLLDVTKPTGLLLTFRLPKKIEDIRNFIKKASLSQKQPLFYGGDNCQVFYKNKNIRLKPEINLNRCQSRLRATVSKISGCNFLFNPVIEKPVKTQNDSNYDKKLVMDAKRDIEIYGKVGIFLTLKHFPFTTADYDIHEYLIDFKVSAQKIKDNHLKLFSKFKGSNFAVMTTHVVNSMVDKDIVTFSEKWNKILRNNLKFKDNLIITDSINMFFNYGTPVLSMNFKKFDWASKMSAPAFIYIRAILAGHDIVINRSASTYQQTLIYDVVKAMEKDYFFITKFKANLLAAKERVISFKRRYRKQLIFFPEINQVNTNFLLEGIVNKNTKNSFCAQEKISNILKQVEIF